MGEVSGAGNTNLGVRGNQILLGSADVRTSLKEGRRYAGGNIRCELLFRKFLAADHRAGVIAKEKMNSVLGLLYLLFE